MNFTPKQLNILKLIYQYQQQHSCSPTYKEIGLTLGISGVTVYEHLCALEKKGAITRRAYDARSVELTSLALNLMVKKQPETIDKIELSNYLKSRAKTISLRECEEIASSICNDFNLYRRS